MEGTKKKVVELLDQFLKEEYGNRLSQFSMAALKNAIMEALEPKEGEKNGT